MEFLAKGCCCNQSRPGEHVLHTVVGKRIDKPVNVLSLAWRDAGRKGGITFNRIRSSVSTQVRT